MGQYIQFLTEEIKRDLREDGGAFNLSLKMFRCSSFLPQGHFLGSDLSYLIYSFTHSFVQYFSAFF